MKDQAHSSSKKEAEMSQAVKSPHYIFCVWALENLHSNCEFLCMGNFSVCVRSICSEGGRVKREVNKCGKGKIPQGKA